MRHAPIAELEAILSQVDRARKVPFYVIMEIRLAIEINISFAVLKQPGSCIPMDGGIYNVPMTSR
jgi:hypothetical protein